MDSDDAKGDVMRSRAVVAMVIGASLLIGACTSGAAPGSSAPAGGGGGAGGDPSAPGQTTSTAGGGGGGGGGTVTDPCSLLTQAEVSVVLGQQVGPGSSANDSKSCDWQYPVGGVPTVQATIGIEDGTLTDMCGTKSNPDLGLTITQVSGVGDGACFQEMAGLAAGTNLTFGKNGQTFSTGVVLGPNATSSQLLDADKALALDALGHQ
jgi:hypothetical protein